MFTPTHFVQTDEAGAKNNHVENGELLQLTCTGHRDALTGMRLDAFLNQDGHERSLFSERVQEFDRGEHRVTCEYATDMDHEYETDCPRPRVVPPEPEEETVDALPLLLDFLANLRAVLDETAAGIHKVEQTLKEVPR